MGDISKNFNRSEFECKCGECGLDTVDCELIDVLQKIRDKFGPIEITSGYRCEDHNNAVGGKKKTSTSIGSYHLYGRAADFQPLKADIIEVEKYIESLDWQGGLGIYDSFIHIDSRSYKARWRG